jgi:small-conductance mechanosensitive channel
MNRFRNSSDGGRRLQRPEGQTAVYGDRTPDDRCPGGKLSIRVCRPLCGFLILVLFLIFDLACAQNPPAAVPQAPELITYLTETINWYRGTAVQRQIATESSDLTFLNDNRRISREIVQLAFDFARLVAQSQSRQPKGNPTQEQSKVPTQYQRLMDAVARADLKVEESQHDLDGLRKKMETSSGKQRASLESLLAETESELAFRQAHRDALRQFFQFAMSTGNEETGTIGLRAQIEELARSVPAAVTDPEAGTLGQKDTSEPSSGKIAPSGDNGQPPGIWSLAGDLLRLRRKRRTLDQQIQSTDKLMQFARQVRRPLAANLRSLIQEGDHLVDSTPSRETSRLVQQKRDLDALTAQYKEVIAELMPVGKQSILVNAYRASLTGWRDLVHKDYGDQMRNFLLRLGFLFIVIAAVLLSGEAWRRAIFRYIHETRRRYQFLLLRKIVMWIVVAFIVGFTFTTELGSVATFAGLLTAGVAVALQNVILSVAGYFFLMGKYGVRVGDRVQIAGVTGEVVDIGLVRLHLLELSSGGTDAHPSGRVVAFSNSVVFQPTSGVFKKIPGTNFVWHEITVTFSPENNYRTIQERITRAVDIALNEHAEEMQRQIRHMEKTLNSISEIDLRPKTHLHSTASGLQVLVRFPVQVQHAPEIDEGVMRELNAAIEQEPRLTLAGTGMLTLRTDLSDPQPGTT